MTNETKSQHRAELLQFEAHAAAQVVFHQYKVQFHWYEATKTWCLSGIDSGGYWESGNYEAADRQQGENDAVETVNNLRGNNAHK